VGFGLCEYDKEWITMVEKIQYRVIQETGRFIDGVSVDFLEEVSRRYGLEYVGISKKRNLLVHGGNIGVVTSGFQVQLSFIDSGDNSKVEAGVYTYRKMEGSTAWILDSLARVR